MGAQAILHDAPSLRWWWRDLKGIRGFDLSRSSIRILILSIFLLGLVSTRHIYAQELADLREDSYQEIGINIGTPAALNLAFGHWFNSVGVRVSGMYFGQTNGVQLNLGLKLSDNARRRHALFIIGGISNIDLNNRVREWTFLGLVYNLNFRGFFLEPGLTFGEGDYSNPQVALQIGYMHRFLP